MSAYGLSLLSGIVTVVNPCVLPLLPIVLASALQEGRAGPLALIAGLVASFTLVSVVVTSVSFAVGFDPEIVRSAAAAVMAAAGLLLVSPPLMQAFTRVVTPLAGGAAGFSGRLGGHGAAGQAGLGAILGVVWIPCTGPTLGAAFGLALSRETMIEAASLLLVFGIGTAIPLLALAYGSRSAIAGRRDGLRRAARWAKPVMGAALLGIGLLILTGLDRRFESWVLDYTPLWLIRFATSF